MGWILPLVMNLSPDHAQAIEDQKKKKKSVAEGHQEDVTTSWPKSWTQATRGSSPTPLSWEYTFCPHSHTRSRFRGCSLQRATCCWDCLDGDWPQLRPLRKLLLFCWWGSRSIYFAAPPGQAWYVNSLAWWNCHLPNWRGLPVVSPCPLRTGASFTFHLGTLKVQTKGK